MDYPWFSLVSGVDVEQGDIFENCPVFFPPDDLAEIPLVEAVFAWKEQDVIVLSQTCDMVQGREKITEALLVPIWKRSELTEGFLSTTKGMEEARRGNLPGFHVLASCDLPSREREVCIVDFRRVYSLPLTFLRRRSSVTPDRLRLMYVELEYLFRMAKIRARTMLAKASASGNEN
jgi:hypothetical protein